MCTILRKSASQCQNNEKLQEKDCTKSQVKFWDYNNSKKKILEKKTLGKSDSRTTSQSITPGHVSSNRSNFQKRRAQKQPAIEEREMLELEEKLKKTEENVFRLQNLTYNESLNQFFPKGTKLIASDSSFNLDEIFERKKDKEFSDMPDSISRKYDKCSSKKSSVKKKKIPEDNEYDSLSILMDERRARRAAALRCGASERLGECGDEDDGEGEGEGEDEGEGEGVGESGRRAGGAEPSASESSFAAAAAALAAPLRSALRSPSPSPPASSLSLAARRSDEALATTGALSSSLADLSETAPGDALCTSSLLSEIEARPSSRLSGVIRFVRAATHAADYSALVPDEQARAAGPGPGPRKLRYGLGFTNVMRGVMLQDKGAVRNLKSCVREIQVLQKKMKKIRSQDAFSTFQDNNSLQEFDSTNNIKNSNPEGEAKLQRTYITSNQDPIFNSKSCARGRVTLNNTNVKEWRNDVQINSPNSKPSLITLHKAKSDLLQIYGKAGVNITALRRLGERTRWKL